MAKYKVKVIAHLCKNNHLAKFGEEIDETQLTSNAADLVNAGFIELVEHIDEKEEDSYDLDKLTKKELIEFAKANNLEVSGMATKDVILDEIEKQILDKEVQE
jgi:hypothetical protein